MTVALPAPPNPVPPAVPNGVTVVPVDNQAELNLAYDQIALGRVDAWYDVAPQRELVHPTRGAPGRPEVCRSLRKATPSTRRPVIGCLSSDNPNDWPHFVDTARNNYCGIVQGDMAVVYSGWRMTSGAVWGFGLGFIGGLPTEWGRYEGLRDFRLERFVVSSDSEAALIANGRGVHRVEVADGWVIDAAREGIYQGDGTAGSDDIAALIDGITWQRIEIVGWGRKTGAEAFDWKHGRGVLIEDLYAHNGRCFSQAAITAPGPNRNNVTPNKPSGTLRRIAVAHVTLEAGRGAIDGSGIYLSAGDVTLEDYTCWDVPGWAILRGRNHRAGGTVTVTRAQHAGCRSGAVNLDGGPNSGGYETGQYPTLVQSDVVERTGLSGAPSSWMLADFGTVPTPPPPPPPPPPPVEPPPTEPPTGDLGAEVEALRVRMQSAEVGLINAVTAAAALTRRVEDLEDTRASIHAVTAPEEQG